MTRRVLSALAFLASLLFASPASADRILLIDDEDTRAIGVRLRAELVALGFEVALAPAPPAEPSRVSLEDAARGAGAIAALRVRASRAGAEVWIMDRVTSKTVLREVIFTRGDDEGVVAIGAVELLRASLLEVEMPSARSREVTPTPAMRSLLAPRRAPPERRWSLVIAPAVAVSPGGLGATPLLDLWIRLRAAARFAVAFRLLAPTLPASVEAVEGRSTVTLALPSIAGDALFFRDESALQGHAGVGVGVLWAHMEGTATRQFVGRGDDVLAALAYVHGGATFALGESVRLFADATLAVATPRPVMSFADRPVAAWGQPAAALAIGLELPLF